MNSPNNSIPNTLDNKSLILKHDSFTNDIKLKDSHIENYIPERLVNNTAIKHFCIDYEIVKVSNI